ncbi:MAG: lysophospholipid acyltransferase family protein [Pseudomonadota bacterium]
MPASPWAAHLGELLVATAFRLHRWSSYLPAAVLRGGGALVGRIALAAAASRREIARANIAKAYPEHSREEHDRLLRAHFRSLGIGLGELGLAWYASDSRLGALSESPTHRVLTEAQARGRGIILLCGHFTTLDLANRLLALYIPHATVWRPLGNPVADRWIRRGREQGAVELIEKSAFKHAIRWLRKDGALLLASDQADSSDGAVEAPFLGHSVATNITAWRLAKSTGCAVVPVVAGRQANGRYHLDFDAPLDALPTLDAVGAATLLNQTIEAQLERYPDQYYWVHRRFKRAQRQ